MAIHVIYPHGLPTPLASNFWQVQGSLPFPLPRNMSIVRLADGGLLLYSVVAMNEAGMRALEALGKPAVMLVPTPHHTMDAAFYAQRYPQLQVIAAAETRLKLDKSIAVAGEPAALLPGLGVRYHLVEGFKTSEVVLEIDTDGGRALIFTDSIGATAPGSPLLLRLLGAPGGSGVARIVKFRQVRDKAALRRFILRLSETPDLKLVACSHGPPITTHPAAMLRRAAADL